LRQDVAILSARTAASQPEPVAVVTQTEPAFPTLTPDQTWRGDVEMAGATDPMPSDALPDEVRHLQYLVAEMGLDAKTALVLMQFIKPEDQGQADETLTRSYHDTLAQTILEDLEADLDASAAAIGLDGPDDAPNMDKKGGDDPAALPANDASVPDLLNTIEADMAPIEASTQPAEPMEEPVAEPTEEPIIEMAQDVVPEPVQFQPLSDYFNTVLNTN
ncbi:MAG: hypothetical protein AAF386_04280, partial [Pseudomonadota bacterium]